MNRCSRSATLTAAALALASLLSVNGFSPHPKRSLSSSPVTIEAPPSTARNYQTNALTEEPQHSSPKSWKPIRKTRRDVKSVSIAFDHKKKAGSSKAGLTREEEIMYSFRIRTLRAATKLRLQNATEKSGIQVLPSHKEWAASCGTTVKDLHRILDEGQEARAALVAANIGLVTSLAKRQHSSLKIATEANNGVGTILTLQDLVQEGTLGLMKAAERYQPEKGFRFSTYATYWVRQRILQAVSDSSRTIRLPAHVHGILSKLNKARNEIKAHTGRDATLEQLSQYLEIPKKRLKTYTQKTRNVMSLEMPLRPATFKDDTRTLGDSLASDTPTPEEYFEADYLRRDVHQVMDTALSDTERDVLTQRFGLKNGDPKNVVETAEALGMSRDRVRLIEARAINKLRSPQKNYRLQQYVEEGSRSIAANKRIKPPVKPQSLDSGRVWFF